MTTSDYCDLLFDSGADFILFTAGLLHKDTKVKHHEAVEDVARHFPWNDRRKRDCYEPDDLLDYLRRGCAIVLAGRGILKDVLIAPKR